jgi:hypothetical protein
MSVIGNIVSAIFPSPHTPSRTAAAAPSTTTSSPATLSAGLAPAKPISQTDLQGILEKLAANQSIDSGFDEVAETGQ